MHRALRELNRDLPLDVCHLICTMNVEECHVCRRKVFRSPGTSSDKFLFCSTDCFNHV